MKSLFETLAVLGTGAALLSGCGGAAAPVNSAEVPAATEAKPAAAAAAPAVENKSGSAAAGAVATAAAPLPTPPPAATVATAVAAPPAKSAAPAAPAKALTKRTGAKKTDANGSCGAGTCA
jgi:hypothetical protein